METIAIQTLPEDQTMNASAPAKELEDRFSLKFIRVLRIAKLMQARHFSASTPVIAAEFAAIYGCGYVELGAGG